MPLGKMTPNGVKFSEGLLEALERQGIKCSPLELPGAYYWFRDEETDHHIGGQIINWDFGPEDGLVLYVTSPWFRGVDVQCLAHDGVCWYVKSQQRSYPKSMTRGELTLF